MSIHGHNQRKYRGTLLAQWRTLTPKGLLVAIKQHFTNSLKVMNLPLTCHQWSNNLKNRLRCYVGVGSPSLRKQMVQWCILRLWSHRLRKVLKSILLKRGKSVTAVLMNLQTKPHVIFQHFSPSFLFRGDNQFQLRTFCLYRPAIEVQSAQPRLSTWEYFECHQSWRAGWA